MNDNDEQLRRLVKYLKAWKDYKSVPLKGIEITILVSNNYVFSKDMTKSLYVTQFRLSLILWKSILRAISQLLRMRIFLTDVAKLRRIIFLML